MQLQKIFPWYFVHSDICGRFNVTITLLCIIHTELVMYRYPNAWIQYFLEFQKHLLLEILGDIKKQKTYFVEKLLISIKFQSNFKQFLTSSMYSAFTLILNSFFWYLHQEYFYYFWSSAMHWAAKVIRGHALPKKMMQFGAF